MSLERKETDRLGANPLLIRVSPSSEEFKRELYRFRKSINNPLRLNLNDAFNWSPWIIWEGPDMDNVSSRVSLASYSVDSEFRMAEAIIRIYKQKEVEKERLPDEELSLSVASSDFGRRGFYIGARSMVLDWFQSVAIATQDCISPRSIQACLKATSDATLSDADGHKIKPDRIGVPLHREFCRQLSIAKYGG